MPWPKSKEVRFLTQFVALSFFTGMLQLPLSVRRNNDYFLRLCLYSKRNICFLGAQCVRAVDTL